VSLFFSFLFFLQVTIQDKKTSDKNKNKKEKKQDKGQAEGSMKEVNVIGP